MKRSLSEEQILEIGRTYGRTQGPSALSKKLGVSKQYIQQIASKLRAAGLPIPKIRLTSFEPVIEQLKKEFAEKENIT